MLIRAAETDGRLVPSSDCGLGCVIEVGMMRIYNHFLMKPVVDDRVLDKSTVYSSEVTDVLMKALAFSLLAVPDEIDYRAVKIFESDHMH